MKSVGTSLHELTKPIHKELNVCTHTHTHTHTYVCMYVCPHIANMFVQEYLSIMKWNDRNYWAIKLASEKSHRSLLRFMKKYKVID